MAIQTRQAALCLFRRGDSFLVAEIRDPHTGTVLHRPPGGGIEDRENPEETVWREIQEELAIVLGDIEPLGAIEHTWSWGGREIRETAWIFLASASDYAAIDREETPGLTEANGDTFKTLWRETRESAEARPNLCPAALLRLLEVHNRW